MVSGMVRAADPRHPAPSSTRMARGPGATVRAISARWAFIASLYWRRAARGLPRRGSGADGTEDVAALEAGVTLGPGPCTAFGPDAGECALLAHARVRRKNSPPGAVEKVETTGKLGIAVETISPRINILCQFQPNFGDSGLFQQPPGQFSDPPHPATSGGPSRRSWPPKRDLPPPEPTQAPASAAPPVRLSSGPPPPSTLPPSIPSE